MARSSASSFVIDAQDREIIAWRSVAGRGISGSDVRGMMLECVEKRFTRIRAPHPVEWLSNNGSPYTAKDTRDIASQINLVPCFTPVASPQSNGMSEAFVRTFKRDYLRINPMPDALTVLQRSAGCSRTTTKTTLILGFECSRPASSSEPANPPRCPAKRGQQQPAAGELGQMGIHCITRSNAPVETVPYLHSVIPRNRLNFLTETCRQQLRRCPGNVIEVGVYRGGSLLRLAQVLKQVCPQYRVIGIDTFSGHPYTDGHPVHPKGKYGDVDMAELRKALDSEDCGALINLHRGRVENILQSLSIDHIAFAHIDCDLYLPVRYCAVAIPRRMHANGAIYFDDFGHKHCPGATRAVLETFPHRAVHEVSMPDDGTTWSCYIRLDE